MATQTTTPSASKTPSSKPRIVIRKAHLYEAPSCGRIAAKTYYDAAIVAYLSPYRAQYYSHYERGFIQRSWKRMLDPRNLTFVAVLPSAPSVPIAYTQLARLGDDEGAKKQIASRAGVGLMVAGWMFWVYGFLLGWVVGEDRSVDKERERAFEEETRGTEEDFWRDGRADRWYVQSCVVMEEWQGMGIGKKLMAEVIARAELEGVVVGLEASGPGEKMYRSVGFELLQRFKKAFGDEKIAEDGGVMIWRPEKLRSQPLRK